MIIKDYANDMNFTIQEVINKCKELGIKVTNANDYLTDDDIVMLDNAMNLISTDSENDFDEVDALDDAVEEILGESNINRNITTAKQKLKKKATLSSKDNNDYINKKKAMYKNKNTKLDN